MAIKANELINIITSSNTTGNSLVSIILRYAELKDQLENPSEQTWYFQKGIESRKKQFLELKSEYEGYRKYFNSFSLDQLIEKKNKHLLDLARAEGMGGGIMKSLALSSLHGKISYIEQHIMLRKKLEVLNEIDVYINNNEELLKLL